jgi:transposase
MVVLASAGGNTVPAIARLVQADEDTIRQVIHRFNEMGMAGLDPRWEGGRPRLISSDDEQFIVTTANTRPEALGRPFTRWSVRKLADYLTTQAARPIRIGRERLRQLLIKHGITFQRTKTWKESNDPRRDAKLARIDHVTSHFPQRVFAFDEFGPLVIRPQAGSGWAPKGHPHRLPANYHKLHGVRQFHGCYSVGDDQLWGVVHRRKSAANTRAATHLRDRWFQPPHHPALIRHLHRYLRWRNTNARHPDVLAAQRRERARIRSERQRRWGQPATRAA